METVVKLSSKIKPAGKDTIDLRQDNRIGELLDEYEYAARVLIDAAKAKKKLTDEIKAKLGDHKKALVDGWLLSRSSYEVKEHVVKTFIADKLRVLRKPKLM